VGAATQVEDLKISRKKRSPRTRREQREFEEAVIAACSVESLCLRDIERVWNSAGRPEAVQQNFAY